MEKFEVVAVLKQFIMSETNIGDDTLIQADTELFRNGLLDSLMAVSLMSFCEDNFRCNFESEDSLEDILRSLDTLADFICNQSVS